MRASVHLVRPWLAPQAPTEDGQDAAPRRWQDSGLAVLCCLLDLSGFAASAVWAGTGEPVGGLLPGAGIVAVAAVAVPALVLRRRAPRLAFGAVWLHGVVSVLAFGYRPFAGLAAALYTITTRERRPVALLALAAALIPCGVGMSALGGDRVGASGDQVLTEFGVAGGVLVAAWLLGQRAHVGYRRRALRQQRWDAELREAAVAERSRVAHELLGIVTYCLSTMLLQAAGARRVLASDPERAARALTSIEASGMQATGELYRLLAVLRGSGFALSAEHTTARPTAASLSATPEVTGHLEAASEPAGPAAPLDAAEATRPSTCTPGRAAAHAQARDGTWPRPVAPGRHRALTDLQLFLDQARAAGVPVHVLTRDEPDADVANLDLSTGRGSAHRMPDAASTVELRWADGALELVVAAVAEGRRDHVPTPRATAQESLHGQRTVSASESR